MTRTTHRRRYLELLSTGLVGLLAGCAGRDDGPVGDDEDEIASQASDLGATPGGAQDVNDFRNNVAEGYLPVPESLSHEGLYSEYYFDTGGDGDGCESLLCTSYAGAVSEDPLSGEQERFFTVGLDSGRSLDEFERPDVNLVVVLDVSGSMDSPFPEYYYDPATGEEESVDVDEDRSKMEVATDAVVTLIDQLRGNDRFGLVQYGDEARTRRELRRVDETDVDELREDVRSIEAGGGTNVGAGIERGLDELEPYADADPEEVENRIVVLTDAQPNQGELSSGGLRAALDAGAEDGLHATFVGIGLDFNPELVDEITSIRGANYYTVRTPEEFETRMGEEFEFVVTPLAHDLTVEVDASDHEIAAVYGSSVDDAATDALLSVPTLFPSPSEGGETRGGVVLVELADTAASDPPEISATWETRTGEQRSDEAVVSFPSGSGDRYANTGVRKAVLLARYGNLLRNWMAHERDEDAVETGGGIESASDDVLGRWEQTSEPLVVTQPYEDRIREFSGHFEDEMEALDDEDLERETDVIEAILASAGTESTE